MVEGPGWMSKAQDVLARIFGRVSPAPAEAESTAATTRGLDTGCSNSTFATASASGVQKINLLKMAQRSRQRLPATPVGNTLQNPDRRALCICTSLGSDGVNDQKAIASVLAANGYNPVCAHRLSTRGLREEELIPIRLPDR